MNQVKHIGAFEKASIAIAFLVGTHTAICHQVTMGQNHHQLITLLKALINQIINILPFEKTIFLLFTIINQINIISTAV